MKNLALIAMGLCLFACSENKTADTSDTKPNTVSDASYSVDGKKVKVYTTAENTKERISLSDKLTFEEHPQPLETDVCIFVDPTHQFQTITGFGGAIVDASAEIFAQLPKEK